MSWYNEKKDLWKEIIEAVAAEEHRTKQMIEKDTIQSMFLHKMSQTDIPFVFKGGTSLSKCYRLIDRFSEDIDLSLKHRPAESERKVINGVILSISHEMGLILTNPQSIRSRHSYNQ